MNIRKWTMRRAVLGLVIGCTLFAIIAQTVVFEVVSRQQIRRESLLNNDETLERIEDEISSYFHNNIIKMQAIYNETDLVYDMRNSRENRKKLLDYYWTAWHLSERRFDSADQLLAMYLYDNDSYLISSFRKQPYYYPQDLYKTEQYVNAAHLKSNRLKAIGAGETAARFAGVRVEKTKMLVYMAAGMITGLAAFINSIKVGSVTSTAGNQLETQIMIALVLGGMPVNGGAKVKFYNIILGALTYKILTAGLVMLGIEPKTQQLIMGIVFLVLVAVFADRETGMIVK